MSEYLFLLPIIIAFILGVMSPRPSFLVIAQITITHSRKKALIMAQGMGLGAMIFALLAASEIYVLLKSVPWIFMSLKIIGGAYLSFTYIFVCLMAFVIDTSWYSLVALMLSTKKAADIYAL